MTPESSPGGFQEADQLKQLSELNYKGLFFLGVPCSPPGSDLGAKNPAQEAPGAQHPAQEAPGGQNPAQEVPWGPEPQRPPEFKRSCWVSGRILK